MQTHHALDTLREDIKKWKKKGLSIGFVPTMGFLHEGHLSLVRQMREKADKTVVSIFVNPLQFNDPADFEKYPIDIGRDTELLKTAGADILFLPSVMEMYPEKHQTRVSVTKLSAELEGAFRPGHFEGVSTVVTMLFNMVTPDKAIFGEKDFQQLRIIEQLVHDLALPIEIVRGAIVRDKDGLAMSSRNVRLTPKARQEALCLSRSLQVVRDLYQIGERDAGVLKRAGEQIIAESSMTTLEYFTIVEEERLISVKDLRTSGRYRALVAAFVDGVRLIDTMSLV